MDDIVAIKARDSKPGTTSAFLTWGRLFDAIDDTELLMAVRKALQRYGESQDSELTLCRNLSEVSTYPGFYEALFHFAIQGIPFGDGYKKWAKRKRKLLRRGEDIRGIGILPNDAGSPDAM